MADFCRECAMEHGFPQTDLAGLCEPGQIAPVICEGCGTGWVDHEGWCMDSMCMGSPFGGKHHERLNEAKKP